MEFPELKEPIDEAELDAVEASAVLHLSKKRQKTLPNPNPNPNFHRRLPNWTLSRPSCNAETKVRYPPMRFGGRIVYGRTRLEVERATMELLGIIESEKKKGDRPVSIGFDIEWKPTFRKGEIPRKAAVIQLCMDNSHCFVLHIIHSGIPPILRSLLENDSYIKVGVAVANDALKILKDYDVHVEALEDLSGLANQRLGGISKNWSLSALTQTLTCKELAKPNRIRLGNWEAHILSRDQLHYAATDAFVSWYLYQVLKSFPDAANVDKSRNQLVGDPL